MEDPGYGLMVTNSLGQQPNVYIYICIYIYCTVYMYVYVPAPSKGWCLNPKGLLNGTLYHPFGTPWRVQVYIYYICVCVHIHDAQQNVGFEANFLAKQSIGLQLDTQFSRADR